MNPLLRLVIISLLMLFISACQNDNSQLINNQSVTQPETNINNDSTIGMIQHTVYFYLNDEVTEEEKTQFEAGLAKLMEIPEIYRSETGIPAGTAVRDVTDHSYAYAIFTWFESMEDYVGYDEHPDHLEFIDTYNHLWAEVKVYDADIIDVQ